MSNRVGNRFIGSPIYYYPNGYVKKKIIRNSFNKIIDDFEFSRRDSLLRPYIISIFLHDTISIADTGVILLKFSNSKINLSEFSILSENEFNDISDLYLYKRKQRIPFLEDNMFIYEFMPTEKGWNKIYGIGYDYKFVDRNDYSKFTALRFVDSIYVR